MEKRGRLSAGGLLGGKEAAEEEGKHFLRILAETVAAVGNTPVVHHGSFKQGIGPGDVVDGKVAAEKVLLLAVDGYLPQQLVVGTVRVQQVLGGLVCQLGTEELGQYGHGNRIFYHKEEFFIYIEKLFQRIQIRGHGFHKLFVFVVEEDGQGTEQGILGGKIVIEGSLGSFGQVHNVVNGGIFVAVAVEKLPGCGYDSAFCLT